MKIIQNLKQRGIGIIYISHYLEEIFMIVTITIFKRWLVNTYDVASVDIETVIRGMVGRGLGFIIGKIPLGPIQVQIQTYPKRCPPPS